MDAKTSAVLSRLWEPVAEEMSTAQQLYREVVLASAERNHIHQILSNANADFIPSEFRIDVVDRVSHHFLQGGGKWIRAGLVLLSAHAFGARGLPVRKVAVAVELIHLATLTHDDIIDEAITRRGRVSVCHGWGNSIAVLIGDFLFSKAFKLLLESGSVPSQEALAVATGQMCMGEIKQLSHVHRFLNSEAQYLETIEHKTAALMAAATQSGGELAGCDQETTKTLSRVGHDIGMAFQIVDDILDYTSSLATMGKEQGGDLRNGKLTLPLIHLLERRPEMLALIQDPDCSPETFARLKQEMDAEGSFQYSYSLARRCVNRARTDLAGLLDRCERPEGIASLQALTELILTRES
ncbi:MAG: polyprenyl synthetase family protein [bacterium]